MRLGMPGGKRPPSQIAGWGIIALGALILLLALPLYVYAALVGCLVCYLGYSLKDR